MRVKKGINVDIYCFVLSVWEYHVLSAQIWQHALSFLKVFGYYTKAAISQHYV